MDWILCRTACSGNTSSPTKGPDALPDFNVDFTPERRRPKNIQKHFNQFRGQNKAIAYRQEQIHLKDENSFEDFSDYEEE